MKWHNLQYDFSPDEARSWMKCAFLCMCILNTTVIRSQLSGATTETGAILESNLRVGVIPLNVPMRHTFLTTFLSLYSQ